MKVVLIKDVKGVGRRFEEKEVSNGYAQNFLIPKNLAVPATGAKAVLALKAQADKNKEVEVGKLEEKIKELNDIKIHAAGNEQGHLFAGIGKEEISKITGLPEDLILLDKPIKEFGSHSISIKMGDKEKKLKLVIEPKA